MDDREALLRAATYLKWFRDRAITADTASPEDREMITDTAPPEDLGEVIVALERLADQRPPPRPHHEPPVE